MTASYSSAASDGYERQSSGNGEVHVVKVGVEVAFVVGAVLLVLVGEVLVNRVAYLVECGL